MLDQAQIRALLPHRFPMLLLDRVDHYVPGVSLTGIKAVTAAEPCYQCVPDGLSARAYAYPVALMLESFGQAAGVLWKLSNRSPDGQDLMIMLGGVRDCQFDGAAYPGDLLRHEVRFGRMGKDAAYASGETWVGDRRIAVMGSFLAVLRPWEEALSQRLGAAPRRVQTGPGTHMATSKRQSG